MLVSKNRMKRTTGTQQLSQITFTTQLWREGRTYVAYTPELDISSCGRTLVQAKRALRDAVSLFLEESAERGVLGDILSEAGFEKRGKTYRSRRVLVREKVRLSLPVAS